MNYQKQIFRSLFFLFLLTCLLTGLAGIVRVPVNAAPVMLGVANIVISEFRSRGTTATDEFVELFNPTSGIIDISDWTIRKSSGCGGTIGILETIPAGTLLNPGQHYLAAGKSYVGSTSPDYRHNADWGIADTGGVAVLDDSGTPVIIDQVGMCSTTTYREGAFLSPLSGFLDQSYDRNTDISSGACVDSDDNATDFFRRNPSDPQNLSSPLITCGNPTPVPTATKAPVLGVVISEFRTQGPEGGDDEFIELYNRTSRQISIEGWIIKKSSCTGSTPTTLATITAPVILKPGQHYLIGGTSYSGSVSANLNPNKPLSIASNGGIALFDRNMNRVDAVGLCTTTLYHEGTALTPITKTNDWSYDRRSSKTGQCVETNNNASDFILRSPSDPQNLASRPLDVCGNPTQTPTPTRTPTRTRTPTAYRTATKTRTPTRPAPPPPLVGINEALPRPGHDWNNDGVVNAGDEYIELLNYGVVDVNLSGYSLDDEANIGSSPYRLPSVTLKPGERKVFYGSQTGLSLSDGGDGVRLIKSNGQLADAYNYFTVDRPDQSFCRLPDNGGMDDWNQNCYPTPGLQNSLRGSFINSNPDVEEPEPSCPIADTLPIDFTLAECQSFGNNIWNRYYWDKFGWYGEKTLPGIIGKWDVYVD